MNAPKLTRYSSPELPVESSVSFKMNPNPTASTLMGAYGGGMGIGEGVGVGVGVGVSATEELKIEDVKSEGV